MVIGVYRKREAQERSRNKSSSNDGNSEVSLPTAHALLLTLCFHQGALRACLGEGAK